MTRRVPPPNLGSLTKRIATLAVGTGRPVRRIQRAVANTVIGPLRVAQSWPPTVVAHEGWDRPDAAAAEGRDVLPDVARAVTWTNVLIASALTRGDVTAAGNLR